MAQNLMVRFVLKVGASSQSLFRAVSGLWLGRLAGGRNWRISLGPEWQPYGFGMNGIRF